MSRWTMGQCSANTNNNQFFSRGLNIIIIFTHEFTYKNITRTNIQRTLNRKNINKTYFVVYVVYTYTFFLFIRLKRMVKLLYIDTVKICTT